MTRFTIGLTARSAFVCALAALAFSPTTSLAHEVGTAHIGTAHIGDLVIEGAWTRQPPPRAAAGGAYMTIRNTGDADDVLTAGAVDFAERLEVHEMAVTDGVMTMRMLPDGLAVPAGETVVLEPGGYHVMFMGLTTPPVAGGTVDVTLTFAKAGDVTVTLPVAPIGAPGPEASSEAGHGAAAGHDMSHGNTGQGASTQ